MAKSEHYITIPFPRPTRNVNRGEYSKKAYVTEEIAKLLPVSIRLAEDDRFYIEKQASQLNMTLSEFLRWCGVYAANEIEKHLKAAEFGSVRMPKPIDTTGFE